MEPDPAKSLRRLSRMKFRAGEMGLVGFLKPEDHELSLFHIRRAKSLSVTTDWLVISAFIGW